MEQETKKDQDIQTPPNVPAAETAKHGSRNLFWTVLIVVIAFYVGVSWGKRDQSKTNQPSSEVVSFVKNLSNPKDLFRNTEEGKPEDLDFAIFWEAWKKVDNKYVDEEKLDSQKRLYGAIKGMVGALGDPYSGFMDPQETKEFSEEMEGSFEGIGAELGMKEGILTIVAPIEGMPAEKAGLRSGDKIIKINGDMASDVTIDEAVKKIRGPKGTQVTLTIFRDGEQNTRDISITRDRIEVKSIIYEKKADGVAYIKIVKFAEDTSKEFNKIVSQAIADNSKGIILDVRNNPGGFLDVAVEIASKFIPKNEVVVWEKGRDGKNIPYKAEGGDSFGQTPVVVLMNEGSASASEILAGALRDIKKTLLVGKKSFGKGSVQQLEDFADGSSLRITIAKWFTPSEQSIHEVGLNPDIEVDISNEDYENDRDPQLDRALEEIKKQIQ